MYLLFYAGNKYNQPLEHKKKWAKLSIIKPYGSIRRDNEHVGGKYWIESKLDVK